jgi:hypothetical protein
MGFKDAGKPHYLDHRERLRKRFRGARTPSLLEPLVRFWKWKRAFGIYGPLEGLRKFSLTFGHPHLRWCPQESRADAGCGIRLIGVRSSRAIRF